MTLQKQLAAAQRDPVLITAAKAMADDRLDVAERQLKGRLRADATDVVAIRMLAELAGRLGRYPDAEKLLARALELAPDFHAARANYVTVLHRQSKFIEALVQADRVIAAEPHDLGHLALRAAVQVRTGDYEAALDAYARVLKAYPGEARLWISRGHVLKTLGQSAASVAAYRQAIDLSPTLGDAWWSLANLKTARFDSADIARMTAGLAAAPTVSDRYHLHFALGKALEDAGDYAESFQHYSQGNRLRRVELPYSADRTKAQFADCRRLLTADAFAARLGGGHPSRDPIFVVGLPRAGSTLVEQILASHSAVEGTMELPDIGTIAAGLGGGKDESDNLKTSTLERLLLLSPSDRTALGQCYLDRTRIQRKTDRPRFIDKMPNNFQHIGLIQLILPNATIIDARRHPMANGFSAFKQHFSRGQGFTYDLDDLGRYWCDYTSLMAHFDDVIPGRIHRVHHERLLAAPEAEIRALLAHAGLDFEQGCLEPHRTVRPVRTASAEQVRQPIASAPDESWRHYQPWLGQLAAALGDTPAQYEAQISDRMSMDHVAFEGKQ